MKRKYFQAFALDLPNGEQSPPTLSARGEYDLANFMVACARKYGIPVVEKPELCSALEDVEVDNEVPVELFEVAAAILAEVGALTPARPRGQQEQVSAAVKRIGNPLQAFGRGRS